jgi:hypothetical protein
LQAAVAELPDGILVLRLYALGGSEPRLVRELPVEIDRRSCYLYELDPNREYRVELALRSPGGKDLPVLRSSVAVTPANVPSQWIEDRFASLPVDIPLPTAALFLTGRTAADKKRQMHIRAYQLSLGQFGAVTADGASSSQGILEGFGGRSWSGTLVKK